MKKRPPLLPVFLFIFLTLLAGGIYYIYGNAEPPVLDRSGSLLIENDRSDEGDNPFILEARLLIETPNMLVFDVKYFMSEEIDGTYNISIHPDNSDWSYSMNTLKQGLNIEQITVSYRPEDPEKKQSRSKRMLFYINKYKDGKYIGKVFDRTMEFPKTWTNQGMLSSGL